MSKPTHVSEVKTRYNTIAHVYLDDIINRPALMRAYTGLIEAAEKAGGRTVKQYGSHVQVEIPKTHQQMLDQLQSEQRAWDRMKEKYDSPETCGSDYDRTQLSEWAADNDLEDPFDRDTEPAEA